MTCWRVHKTRGTCRIVNVNAEHMHIAPSGALLFTNDATVVMAYAPWAWKTVCEEPAGSPEEGHVGVAVSDSQETPT